MADSEEAIVSAKDLPMSFYVKYLGNVSLSFNGGGICLFLYEVFASNVIQLELVSRAVSRFGLGGVNVCVTVRVWVPACK